MEGREERSVHTPINRGYDRGANAHVNIICMNIDVIPRNMRSFATLSRDGADFNFDSSDTDKREVEAEGLSRRARSQ